MINYICILASGWQLQLNGPWQWNLTQKQFNAVYQPHWLVSFWLSVVFFAVCTVSSLVTVNAQSSAGKQKIIIPLVHPPFLSLRICSLPFPHGGITFSTFQMFRNAIIRPKANRVEPVGPELKSDLLLQTNTSSLVGWWAHAQREAPLQFLLLGSF